MFGNQMLSSTTEEKRKPRDRDDFDNYRVANTYHRQDNLTIVLAFIQVVVIMTPSSLPFDTSRQTIATDARPEQYSSLTRCVS